MADEHAHLWTVAEAILWVICRSDDQVAEFRSSGGKNTREAVTMQVRQVWGDFHADEFTLRAERQLKRTRARLRDRADNPTTTAHEANVLTTAAKLFPDFDVGEDYPKTAIDPDIVRLAWPKGESVLPRFIDYRDEDRVGLSLFDSAIFLETGGKPLWSHEAEGLFESGTARLVEELRRGTLISTGRRGGGNRLGMTKEDWEGADPNPSELPHVHFKGRLVDFQSSTLSDSKANLVVYEPWLDVRIGISQLEALAGAQARRSGAPGRPTSMHLVSLEFERRIGAGISEQSNSAEAEHLAHWLRDTHPDQPQLKPKSIRNQLGEIRRQVSAAQK